MVNLMVERATSDLLVGPDWAMNIEICDICNNDPSQAKDVVRGVKKRLSSKNPKVQLLVLTLLETIVKNCGEVVHTLVAQRDLPHEMVKIVRKKPDFHVKEKILILIDTWQESFGGPGSRYPQFFIAYQALLRLGAVFPQRPDKSAPIFTPPQTHPLTSYPQNLRNPDSRPDAAESSSEAEFPTLSPTELQNARGIMDVLAEMLNAVDPGNKEAIKQDVIVDLVEQCRTYKQRVVHLVNSTSDESLLSQGLTLNDDLQRVLAKHESIASGTTVIRPETPKPEPAQAVVIANAPLVDTGDSKQLDKGSTSSTSLGTQLLLPAPTATNGQLTTPVKVDPKLDLLSGDDFNSSTANLLALVPVPEPLPVSPVVSQQNALALVDMFSLSTNSQSLNSTGQAYSSSPQFQQQPSFHPPESVLYANGSVYSPMSSQQDHDMITQQQPHSPAYGAQHSNSLPLPPWEAQLDNSLSAVSQSQQMQGTQGIGTHSPTSPSGSYYPVSPTMANNQFGGSYVQPFVSGHLAAMNNQGVQSNQMLGMHPHLLHNPHQMGMYPQPIRSGQMGYMYPQQMHSNQMTGYGYGYGYGYGQGEPQNVQFLAQSMSGLSTRDDTGLRNSSYAASYVPPGKPSKPEDKLFGDLVDISKFKAAKPTSGAAGST